MCLHVPYSLTTIGRCATRWLLDNPTAEHCPVPSCPARLPPAAALIAPTYATKVGFDLGGVLIDRYVNDKSGFNFLSDNAEVYLQAAAVQGAFDAVYDAERHTHTHTRSCSSTDIFPGSSSLIGLVLSRYSSSVGVQ